RIVNTNDKGLKADEVWNINLQKSQQTITQVVCKRAIEHVHSQGRVLGDRSVLYKYLNPNLMAVVTEGEEPPSPGTHKGPSKFFSIYLVDGVTGHIVFHVNHKRCHGPINTVHSENWVVYSYFSEKHRRHEIAVLEMFEGKEQSNSTAFSSLSPPPQPLVLRQSYVFSSPLSAMATTVTEKGLTNKNIIISLKFGGLLSLPKALLDPRRPAMPSQESMEEGVIPYIPEIPIHTEAIINYNRTLSRVDGIYTGPAGLESTSLILTYGLDMFYTRVMPSKMFDVLKEDFDYVLIGSILFIMILVSILTQKLAAKRALSRAWK
ncbi:ER membrane protein complex subunit 1, partial [Patella vulgata]|uniref:ER membrane protein complex subunit 1 n=1 Tax=Patella vulgata TaxID=6465 RepID=UPI0024A92EAE